MEQHENVSKRNERWTECCSFKLTSKSCSEMLYDEMSCSTSSSSRLPSPARATEAPDTADPCDNKSSLLRFSSALYFACIPRYSCLFIRQKILMRFSIKSANSILTFAARRCEPAPDIPPAVAPDLIPSERFSLSAVDSRSPLPSTPP